MKKIFAIAWKDAIIRFASSSELLFFIILPVVFTFLLAGGTPAEMKIIASDCWSWMKHNTAISQQIIDELGNSTAVRPEVTDTEEAQSQFDDRRAAAMFFIPAGVDLNRCKTVPRKWNCFSSPTI